jgi:hypothetical protein
MPSASVKLAPGYPAQPAVRSPARQQLQSHEVTKGDLMAEHTVTARAPGRSCFAAHDHECADVQVRTSPYSRCVASMAASATALHCPNR